MNTPMSRWIDPNVIKKKPTGSNGDSVQTAGLPRSLTQKVALRGPYHGGVFVLLRLTYW